MSRPTPHGPVPSLRQMAWHRREVFGFIHFTVNTFTDREWGYGDEAESVFAPTELNCDQWVRAAKAGGLKALILTAKHHDGFCLWPTATTSHHIGKSPFRGGRGDLVREFVDACRRGGIECGLYCSPWDRNHPDYGKPAYTEIFHAQWRELMTNYGELCELWFDGANGGDGYYGGAREKRSIDAKHYYQFDKLWEECRRLQPNASMFSDAGPDLRWCGNEAGFTGTTCWSKVNAEGFAPGEVADKQRLILGEPNGTVWRPAEVDVSIRPGWFWHATEKARSGENLFQLWLASVGRGAGLNLNLTPDRRGLIPSEDVIELKKFRSLVETFTELDLAKGRASGSFAAVTDGNPETFWAAQDAWASSSAAYPSSDRRERPGEQSERPAETPTAEVVVELGQSASLAGIRIEEAIAFGQRIESFAVDVRTWGEWFEMAVGTTIGTQRILAFSPIKGDAVRLRILKSQAPAVLSQIKVYAGA